DVAPALAALGHEARLGLFRLLVKAGPEGLAIGEIQAHLGLAPSTLAHHLRALVEVGLVSQEKRGRSVLNRAVFGRMSEVLGYVEKECCQGVRLGDDAA
ncbi:MAG: metalloregulator ArsR/SmtB family transcription factor, partial [Pseudomonadota bacterium]